MKTFKFLAAIAFMLIISTTTNAQEARSATQQRRIAQGTRNGELTRHESRQLERQQRNIKRERREARADGVVTPREKRQIRKDRRRANRNIIRKKHNRRNSI